MSVQYTHSDQFQIPFLLGGHHILFGTSYILIPFWTLEPFSTKNDHIEHSQTVEAHMDQLYALHVLVLHQSEDSGGLYFGDAGQLYRAFLEIHEDPW